MSALNQLRGPGDAPPNAIVAYIQRGVPTTADIGRYWDKRRIQSCLRRFAESLEEVAPGGRFGDFFTQHVAHGATVQADVASGASLEGVEEEQFVARMAHANAWPSELTENDQRECFAALVLPNVGVARVCHEVGRLPARITQNNFVKGLQRVPYNVPDFPVPSEMMDRTPTDVVLQVANLVTLPRFAETGLHDFTLSSWISAEEIQVLLPTLRPLSEIEKGVVKLLSETLPHFRPVDWQQHVYAELPAEMRQALQLPPPRAQSPYADAPSSARGPSPSADREEPTLASPVQRYRQLPGEGQRPSPERVEKQARRKAPASPEPNSRRKAPGPPTHSAQRAEQRERARSEQIEDDAMSRRRNPRVPTFEQPPQLPEAARRQPQPSRTRRRDPPSGLRQESPIFTAAEPIFEVPAPARVKPLVDWWSCTQQVASLGGSSVVRAPQEGADAAGGGFEIEEVTLGDEVVGRDRALSHVVLDLHPADCVGPFLLKALVHAGRVYLDICERDARIGR